MGRRTAIHNICMIKYKIDYEGKDGLKMLNSLHPKGSKWDNNENTNNIN